jgi:hypothetical protein
MFIIKRLQILSFLFLCTWIISCKKEDKVGLNDKNKFYNYLSMDGKKFNDGNIDFYPMVMNYSMDIHSTKTNDEFTFFASPRSGYHPNYGEKEGEYMDPWGTDSSKNHATIKAHFASIKDMGFNAVRLTGFNSTDVYGNGFHTWSKINISNTEEGNKNILNGMVPLLKTILHYTEENGLRVILLLSAVETQPNNQLNFYQKIAQSLKNEKSLMAYDLYNEPLYFDRGDYTKKETKEFVESYTRIIKEASPNHLTTIGLSHYKIVHEWDPELMDVDFLSFHIYPYGSKNLSILERFEAKLYWISRTITKPWIIGETGLNTQINCDPINFSSGNYSDQLYFISYSLNKNRSAKSSGYSYWSYQDMKYAPGHKGDNCPSSNYGLVSSKKGETFTNSKGDTILGKLKQKINTLPFKGFLENAPYNKNFWDNLVFPEMYYNIDYLPPHEKATGKVVDENGRPIENAIVTLKNTISKSVYTTFTKPDGSFLLFTGWTNIFSKLDFKIRVTAVKKETTVHTLSEKYKGEGKNLETFILKPVK